MDIKELLTLTKDYWGYKIQSIRCMFDKKVITFILYDSFVVECDLSDRYNRFGLSLILPGDRRQGIFLGKTPSMNNDRDSIINSFELLDEYCRLRLPDKFLDAFDKAYNK